jgi:hypothetical protein
MGRQEEMLRGFTFRATLGLVIIIPLLTVAAACGSGSTSSPVGQQADPWPIPADFTTYTKEGYFSISYPQDWSPALSVIEDVWQEIQEGMEALDPDADLKGARMVFLAGTPGADAYCPAVNVILEPCPPHTTIDQVVEASDSFDRDHQPPGYRRFSRTETTIDGRSAVINDWGAESRYGPWRYLQVVSVKDKLVWGVTCQSASADFSKFEGDFYNIIRSFRALN